MNSGILGEIYGKAFVHSSNQYSIIESRRYLNIGLFISRIGLANQRTESIFY